MGERDFPIRSRGDRAEVDYAMSADRSIALLGNVTIGTTITEDEARKAALTLADRAYLLYGESDEAKADCRRLLLMCGLLSGKRGKGRYRWGHQQHVRKDSA